LHYSWYNGQSDLTIPSTLTNQMSLFLVYWPLIYKTCVECPLNVSLCLRVAKVGGVTAIVVAMTRGRGRRRILVGNIVHCVSVLCVREVGCMCEGVWGVCMRECGVYV